WQGVYYCRVAAISTFQRVRFGHGGRNELRNRVPAVTIGDGYHDQRRHHQISGYGNSEALFPGINYLYRLKTRLEKMAESSGLLGAKCYMRSYVSNTISAPPRWRHKIIHLSCTSSRCWKLPARAAPALDLTSQSAPRSAPRLPARRGVGPVPSRASF